MWGLLALFTHRPYVVVFFTAFALLAWSERGLRRMIVWLFAGTAIGWLSELCSVNTGFPFGHYAYHRQNFAAELWIGPVPLFASLSFAFMSYFAFSAACRLLAPRGAASPAMPSTSVLAATTLLAAIIGAWMDTVIDPLSLIGRYWFLGDLYSYDPPGPHFGVPLVNYAGWIVTIGCIVAVNQLLDRWQARQGWSLHRGPALPLLPLWGLGCCVGVFVFILAINILLLGGGTVPPSVPLARLLISGLLSFSLFLVFAIALLRRGKRGG